MATRSESARLARPRGGAVELGIRDPRWLSFVARHPDAIAFHRPEWSELLADSYGCRPFVLAVLDATGSVSGGLPVVEVERLRRRRWIALPFTDVCPPLLRRDLPPNALIDALDEARISAGIGSFLVRSRLSGDGVHCGEVAVIHTLALEDNVEAVFERFHHQVRRNVRRAQREQLSVRRGDCAADLTRTFYALHTQTRHRLGVPVQPRRFFEALWERLLEPGHGHVLLVYTGRDPVAAAVFLTGGSTLTYKYAASDCAHWRLRPNHLLLWSAIRSACESGYGALDFGRSDLEDQGLRDFKSGWGAVEEPLAYSTLGERNRSLHSSRSAPGAARAVFRRSPEWFCRAAGAIIYRYAT
jgi:CelD/BcsL family acetyltransferase involved in cellulose biosynthesis